MEKVVALHMMDIQTEEQAHSKIIRLMNKKKIELFNFALNKTKIVIKPNLICTDSIGINEDSISSKLRK